jgi:hypothetical protein
MSRIAADVSDSAIEHCAFPFRPGASLETWRELGETLPHKTQKIKISEHVVRGTKG